MDARVLGLLQYQDWEAIGDSLIPFGVYWARRYRMCYDDTEELAAGKSVADVVQEVILDAFEGKRRWDPAKGRLLPWLRDQVRSEVDHLFHSASSRHEVPMPRNENGEDDEELLDSLGQTARYHTVTLAAWVANPEDIVLEKERLEQVRARLSLAAGGVPELERVIEALRSGCDPKPRYLAVELGVPVGDIYNRLRRFRRRALRLVAQGAP